MIRFFKNEKGYTLLLTLLLIVIIISLLSTFLFASVTQQKQIEKTDKSFEASSVAEMGAEKIRTIVLNEYENTKSSLQECVDSSDSSPEQIKACTENATNKVKFIKNELTTYSTEAASPKKFHVFKTSNLEDVYYQYLVKGSTSTETIEQFIVEVSGIIPSAQKKIKLTFDLPLALLNEKEPGNGSGNTGGLIEIPLENTIFPAPVTLKQCSKTTALPECKLSGPVTWDDFKLDRSTIYIDGSLNFKLNGKNKDSEDLRNSTLYIRDRSDLYLTNPLTLKNGKIFVYDMVDFTFFSGLNLEMYIEKNANIVNHFDATNSKIVVGGNVSILDKKTMTLANTKMQIKGNLQADNHKNVFVKADKGSTLYLQGTTNNVEQLLVYNNSKVCIDKHAMINNLSIQSGGKVYFPNTYSGIIPPGAKKIANYNEECSLNYRNDYEISPVLTEDDITSDVTYGN